MQPAAPSFADFFVFGSVTENAMRYNDADWFMVGLSYLVAALTSYLAMLILRCANTSRHKTRQLALGAITFGTGVWSMHFIGMLAVKTTIVHEYEPVTTAISWAISTVFSYVVLHNLAYRHMTRMRIFALAPMLALGITAMHYLGMSAMRMDALMRFDIVWFVISLVIALIASTAALILMSYVTQRTLKRPYTTRLLASLIMALAICGMHYGGMVATVFTPLPDAQFNADQNHIELVLMIAACTLIVMGAATLLVLWTAVEASAETSARRWPYVYYLLAGFNMLTVVAGIYMNHRVIEINESAIGARDGWMGYNEELYTIHHSLSRLGIQIAELPSHKSSNGEVQQQLETVMQHMRAFEKSLSKRMHTYDDHEHGQRLLFMMQEALRHEFEEFTHVQRDLARLSSEPAGQAALIKHTLGHIDQLQHYISNLTKEIVQIQHNITRVNNKESAALMKINAVIYFILITLVVLATAGGVRVVRRIRQMQDEKNQYLYKLQKSEASLMESQAFLKKVIDSVADPIFVKNRRHQWIAVNGAFSEMLGYEPEMLIGKSDFDIFPNEQASVFWEMDEKLFAAGEVVVNEEFIRTRAGEDRTILTKKVPVTLSDGTTGIVGIFHDIAEQNMIRDELRRHRDNLAQMVAEQTKDVVDAKEKVESANKAKSEFLSNMSHELRTPIHAIKSFAELSRDLMGRELNDQERHKISRFMHNIIVSVDRLNLLVGDLLDMSKLDSGKIQYTFEQVNVPELVSHCFDQLHGLMLDKHIRYDLDVSEDARFAELDQRTITQVMINLLSNAIKFSPDSGELNCRITRTADDHIRIALTDQGPGIPETELTVIFDKFVQSSKTKTKAGGTGLGLAICRQIVEAHGGSIWYENNPGNPGVTAYVRLPVTHS